MELLFEANLVKIVRVDGDTMKRGNVGGSTLRIVRAPPLHGHPQRETIH